MGENKKKKQGRNNNKLENRAATTRSLLLLKALLQDSLVMRNRYSTQSYIHNSIKNILQTLLRLGTALVTTSSIILLSNSLSLFHRNHTVVSDLSEGFGIVDEILLGSNNENRNSALLAVPVILQLIIPL